MDKNTYHQNQTGNDFIIEDHEVDDSKPLQPISNREILSAYSKPKVII